MVKIAVRPLKGDQFEVEVEPELTVQDLKKKINETRADFPADLQKLIHAGKILQDATKIQDTGIKEGEFVVVMVTKKVASSGTASTPTPATPAAPAPPAAPAADPVPAAPPTVGGDTPMSYETAASNLVTGGAMESTIQQLCDMGYPRADVERCLQAAFNNPDRAVEYLLSGIPEGILPPAGGAAPPAASPTAAPTPGDAAPPAAVPAGGGGASPFPAMTPGAGGGGNPASMAALQELRNNPRFTQLAQMVAANPQSLAQMLPALQQSNPELARAIAENPDAFMQMLAQAAGMPQDRGAGGGGGGPMVVRLTDDERAAVERLEALGFDRNTAIQAYLACDKNEEMAANFLFENGD